MNKDEFQSRFGDDPRRDDMTLLNPKQDDPTEQVTSFYTAKNLIKSFSTPVAQWAQQILGLKRHSIRKCS